MQNHNIERDREYKAKAKIKEVKRENKMEKTNEHLSLFSKPRSKA